jgi:copper chaperone CopZ
MTCGSCVNRITRALKRLDGVDRVRVDLGRELVTIRHDPNVADDAALAAAVAGAGYEAHLDAAANATESDLHGPLARLFGRLQTMRMKENLQ